MQDEWRTAQIKEEYNKILLKIKDGQMFGRPIDTDRISELVVAAYVCGVMENHGMHVIHTIERKANGL